MCEQFSTTLQNRFSLVKVTHEKNTRSSDSKRIYVLNNVMGKWKHYPSNSEPPPSGTVYRQLSLVSKVSCSSNPKLRNWYNINIEYWLFTQTSNFSDLKIITLFQAVILFDFI